MGDEDEADLMTMLLAMKAHVDQLASELHDSDTGRERLHEIRLELKQLLDLLRRFLAEHA